MAKIDAAPLRVSRRVLVHARLDSDHGNERFQEQAQKEHSLSAAQTN